MKPIILSVGENGRGLVYGLVEEYPTPGQSVKLYEARMILYYPSGGTFGLGKKGPPKGSRVTHAIEHTVATVWQEYLTVSDEARAAFDAYEPVP